MVLVQNYLAQSICFLSSSLHRPCSKLGANRLHRHRRRRQSKLYKNCVRIIRSNQYSSTFPKRTQNKKRVHTRLSTQNKKASSMVLTMLFYSQITQHTQFRGRATIETQQKNQYTSYLPKSYTCPCPTQEQE